jgi:phosphoglycolate phosphatase-like HAD superfamily hydrolase
MSLEWKMEITNRSRGRGGFKFALFDFDGTISLIREGWQGVMKTYFYEELRKSPGGASEDEQSLRSRIDEFVDINTGKQTIYQCFDLVEEIKRRGGAPLDAQDYKDEYQRRLLEKVQHRITALENGDAEPEEHIVRGSFELLRGLRDRGVKLFLASGTDEQYASHEADILGVTPYFEGRVYGAQRDYRSFSKKMVVDRIISENNLTGRELLGFGDGFVEIENVSERGGFAVGVASDERDRDGRIDEWKRDRLIRAGADIIIPDYADSGRLLEYLFEERG